MAEHTLETRILLRYDTYIHWINSDIILKPGEAAIAAFPNKRTVGASDDTPYGTPPAIGIKIGDGQHYFDELPWVQGIAADVYKWAKSEDPPSANTIPGLAEYVDTRIANAGGGSGGSGSGSGGIQYRIIYNNSKYILQYYDEEAEDWLNTTSEINLSDIFNRIDTIERWANGARINLGNIEAPLLEYIYEEVTNYINRLDYNDTAVAHQFVTSVTEENGKISVTRATITSADISGTLSTSQGGTGLTYVEEDEVLVGDRNGNITTMRFVTEIDEQRMAFATVGAIKDYVDQQTAGITGAMHFVGEATVEITVTPQSRVDPHISGYTFRTAQPGDVILANNAQEFVWTGSYWRLLGDEGSYAIKGSIKNADIADDADISQSKIAGLTDTLEGKVNVEVGKGLSTNDYTTEDKLKLLGIEDNAQQNVIEHILLNDNEAIPKTVSGVPKTVELNVKEFDDNSRNKLSNIEEGAQVNSIESIALNGTVQTPDQNKQVNLVVSEITQEERTKLQGIEAGAQVNTIEHIYVNEVEAQPDPQTKRVDINIIGITQEQIDKLNSIEEGAQVNIVNGITYNNVVLSPDNNGIIVIEPDPHTSHENVIESIAVNGTVISPDQSKQVNLQLSEITPEQAEKLQGIEAGAQVNKIEHITYDGEQVQIDEQTKTAAIVSNRILGAVVPDGNTTENIEINAAHKLVFAAIAKSGNVEHLLQTLNTYIVLDCGTSEDVID